MDMFKAIVFILHFSFFGLTALFFFLKFHKKARMKPLIFAVGALWILFGLIDFCLELRGIMAMFM